MNKYFSKHEIQMVNEHEKCAQYHLAFSSIENEKCTGGMRR